MENEVLNSQSSKKLIMRVSNISIVVNVLLSAIKFVVGVIANSGAMISDAIHSVSDVFSTIIVMILGRTRRRKIRIRNTLMVTTEWNV